MSNQPKKHIPYCLNCHYPLAEMDSFCPNCGQKPTDGKTSMHDLLHEFVHTLFHLDGKFFTTLKHIFVPGKLTIEFFKGHHKRYAHPVQLFLVLGALLFGMIASSTNKWESWTQEKSYKSRRKVEEKAFLRVIDSIGKATSPSFDGKNTQRAYDSLLFKIYKYRFPKEATVENKNEKNAKVTKKQKDTVLTFAGGAIKVTKNLDDNDPDYENDSLQSAEQIVTEALEKSQKPKNLKDFLAEEDSTNVSQLYASLKIPTSELYELSADEILDKYQIHDFWKKLSLKQAIKAQQDTKSLLHFALGKLLWFTFLLIPLMSGLFMLLYRKRRFFVEHFLFFMHYNIFLFAGGIVMLFLNNKFDVASLNKWFVLGALVFFYFAMKNYYQQGWGKTFVKFCIANFGYMLFSFLLTIVGAILSFLLF